MRNFKKLPAWQKGMEIVILVYELGPPLLAIGKQSYADLMYKAALEIPSNIAIGSSYESDTEYRNYLRMSLGACFQLETLLLVVGELDLVGQEEVDQLSALLDEEKKLLMDFMRQLIWRGA